MSQTPSPTPPPNPVNRENLTFASKIGGVLGVGAIILFVVLWVVFGKFGMTEVPRILLSLCLPPAIMAALIGAYMLFTRSRT